MKGKVNFPESKSEPKDLSDFCLEAINQIIVNLITNAQSGQIHQLNEYLLQNDPLVKHQLGKKPKKFSFILEKVVVFI